MKRLWHGFTGWGKVLEFTSRLKYEGLCAESGASGHRLLRDRLESSTDREARLFKKGGAAAAVPGYLGHVVTENRNGLVVAALATQSSTASEVEAAVAMIDRLRARATHSSSITLVAGKSYQEGKFIGHLRQRVVVPYVAVPHVAVPHVAEYQPNPQWPSFLTEAEHSSPGNRCLGSPTAAL